MTNFTGYSVGSASATIILARIQRIQLPIQTDEAFGTPPTPRGLTTPIDSPPLHQENTMHAKRVMGGW